MVIGGVNAALYIRTTLVTGGKFRLSDVMSAFGDGLASGFMTGGIMAFFAMGVSAGFRVAEGKGVPTGPSKNFNLGRRT